MMETEIFNLWDCVSLLKDKNDRRNSGGTLRQKETKNALKTAKKKKKKKMKNHHTDITRAMEAMEAMEANYIKKE